MDDIHFIVSPVQKQQKLQVLGRRGLVRWLSCGLLAGFLLSVETAILLPLIGNHSLLVPFIEVVVGSLVLYLPYRLVFRRNMFSMVEGAHSNVHVDMNCASWVLMIGGLAVATGCALVAFFCAGHTPGMFWMAIGGFCLSLSAADLGLLGRGKHRARSVIVILPLVVLGLALFLLGVIMDINPDRSSVFRSVSSPASPEASRETALQHLDRNRLTSG